MNGKNVRMSKKKILSRRKVLFSLVGFLMFGLVLFQIDLQEILMNILKCTLCQGHYDFSFSDFYFIFVCCVEASK